MGTAPSKADGGPKQIWGLHGSNPSIVGELLTLYEPAYFITRADNLKRARIFYHACGY